MSVARWVLRSAAAPVALACAAGAAFIAWHHPLAPHALLAAAALLALLAGLFPLAAPLLLLAPLPLIGFMPWSGWVMVEEFDVAVLAVAAALWLRLAAGWGSNRPPVRRAAPLALWLAPLVLSVVVSGSIGMLAAGGPAAGASPWWQAYHEPMNALRLAKPLLWVLLLLPPWRAACRVDDAIAHRQLAWGMTLCLLGTALGVWWERVAFVSLLDFSTDYRATGLWWEMHVGGAALDVALAATLPFALLMLLWPPPRAALLPAPAVWVVCSAILALGLYAALATFSRIVYVAVPLALLAAGLLWARQQQRPGLAGAAAAAGLALALFLALGAWVFPAGGWRGLAALWVLVAALLVLAPRWTGQSARRWALGAAAAVPALVLAGATALLGAKAAYAASAAAALATAVLAAWPAARWGRAPAAASMAAVALAAGALPAVGWHRGGDVGFAAALGAALVLSGIALPASLRRTPAWPAGAAFRAGTLALLLAAGGALGVFMGGAYMSGRVEATASDAGGRFGHWSGALALLRDGDWLFGKGLGRYHANQAFSGRPEDHTGDLRLLPLATPQGTRTGVVLSSGRHDLGRAQAFRLSQRVGEPADGPLNLFIKLRTEAPAKLQAEVCEKNRLYPMRCRLRDQMVEPRGGQWQEVILTLQAGETPRRGRAWAPRTIAFSLALGRHLNRVEIAELSLIDADRRELLDNGRFEAGLARWFTTSDRWHLPWHAKNMALHLLFEQGLLGLAAWGLLLVAALWRCSVGAARRHPLAPALAAALVGVLVVGLVDSVLDMPRVAFVTLLLAVLALALPRPPRIAGLPGAAPGGPPAGPAP